MEKEYIFCVYTGQSGWKNIDSAAEPDEILGEVFSEIVEESKETAYPIETSREENGENIVTGWGFAHQPKEGMARQLDPKRSFRENELQPGDIITVAPPHILGSSDHFLMRIADDKRDLQEFVDSNPDHLQMEMLGPTDIRVKIRNVKGITDISLDGNPFYSNDHDIRLVFPNDYPINKVKVIPLTPIFHPNCSMEEKYLCHLDEWQPYYKQVLTLVLSQVLDLIQYRKVTLKAPHGDLNKKAKKWYQDAAAKASGLFPLEPAVVFRV